MLGTSCVRVGRLPTAMEGTRERLKTLFERSRLSFHSLMQNKTARVSFFRCSGDGRRPQQPPLLPRGGGLPPHAITFVAAQLSTSSFGQMSSEHSGYRQACVCASMTLGASSCVVDDIPGGDNRHKENLSRAQHCVSSGHIGHACMVHMTRTPLTELTAPLFCIAPRFWGVSSRLPSGAMTGVGPGAPSVPAGSVAAVPAVIPDAASNVASCVFCGLCEVLPMAP
jgi:hypothetical protein